MLLRNVPDAALQKSREEWVTEIHQVKCQIEDNERLFNMTCDADIIDYTIHERNALQTRFRYLSRLIRELDGRSASAQQPDSTAPTRSVEHSMP